MDKQEGSGTVVKNGTYVSAEDSELLREAARDCVGKACLEIGFGYASNLLAMAGNFESIVGTEIVRTRGFERLKRNQAIQLVMTDRANCFRNECFDLILVNPPYLPSETIYDSAIDGGKNGFEIPALFLEEALRVVRLDGRILFLISSATSYKDFSDFNKNHNLIVAPIASRSIFFEKLTVYDIRKKRTT